MKRNIFKVIFILPLFVFAISFFANAQNPFDIEFPIKELGSCSSISECKSYCDQADNAIACMSFAEKNGIVKKQEDRSSRADEVLKDRAGPGGCVGRVACDAFCSEPENREICFSFAKENGLISKDKIEKIEKEMESNSGPGGCSSRQQCDTFCKNPDNIQICLDFAVSNGHIDQEEASLLIERMSRGKDFRINNQGSRGEFKGEVVGLEVGLEPEIDKKKAEEVLAKNGGPGGCLTMLECEAFCSNADNGNICLDFAISNNLIPKEKAEKMKEMMNKSGPGGCKGIECKVYCENPENAEACFNFAKENGLLHKDDIRQFERGKDIIKRIEGRGGPGDCRSEKECRAYCQDSVNIDECAAFSVSVGFIDEDEVKKSFEEFESIKDMRNNFSNQDFQGDMQNRLIREGNFTGQGKMQGDFNPEGMMQQGFDRFEKFRDEFKKHEDFCLKPENSESCKKFEQPNINQNEFTPNDRALEMMRYKENQKDMPRDNTNQDQLDRKDFNPQNDDARKFIPRDDQRMGDFNSQGIPSGQMPGAPEGFKQPEGFVPPAGFDPSQMPRDFNLQGIPSGQIPIGSEGFTPPAGFDPSQMQSGSESFKYPEGFVPQIIPQSMNRSINILANPLDLLFNLLK
ncbi:MAG: hypothetical protein AAB614_00265 [Patescibacteria group bacterium]